MSTEYYLVGDKPTLEELRSMLGVPSDICSLVVKRVKPIMGIPHFALTDGKNTIWAFEQDGRLGFIRYGDNDAEPILDVICKHCGVDVVCEDGRLASEGWDYP